MEHRSYDYDTGRITTFLCSVQHSPDVEVSDFRHIIESMMVLAACEYGLDGDFTKLVNPTGRFVLGGSYADCGVTGRKLACDTYGGIGRMGGGALSGKDPTKVDRSAAYMPLRLEAEGQAPVVFRPQADILVLFTQQILRSLV